MGFRLMAPNMMSGVQLIFEFLGAHGERWFIGNRWELDGYLKQCTIYRYRLQYTINIGECT